MSIRRLIAFLVIACVWDGPLGKAQEPGDLNSNTVNPLDPVFRSYWKRGAGKWEFQQDYCITGLGDSSTIFNQSFKTPFHLVADIEVLDGMRPRIVFGKYEFGNEGYQRTFSFFPYLDSDHPYPYELNRIYRLKIDINSDGIKAYIDGHLVGTSAEGLNVVPPIEFRGGDDWSAGTTRFSRIRMTGAHSPMPTPTAPADSRL